MTRKKFIRLSGWALFLAAVALLYMFIGSIALGYILQTDLKPIDQTDAAL